MTETFPALLVRLRSKSGLSLSAASRQLGLSKGHLWEMESGGTDNPTVATVKALSDVYNVSPATLLRAALKGK